MRIVTWNVNGLRAAIRKGIDTWFEDVDADIWMLQETRVLEEHFRKAGVGLNRIRPFFILLKRKDILVLQHSQVAR